MDIDMSHLLRTTELLMIDTIKVKYPILLNPQQLDGWLPDHDFNSTGGINEKWIYNPRLSAAGSRKGTVVRCTYRPFDLTGNKPILTIEFSLPTLLFGNNVRMVMSISAALELANQILASDPRIPPIRLEDGILLRLDCCVNYFVENRVQDYLRAISKLEYPRRRTHSYKGEGVRFECKSICTSFYDKERECKGLMGEGTLRHESRFRKNSGIEAVSGKKKTHMGDITEEMVYRALQKDLERLKLAGNVIGTVDEARKALVAKHGALAGVYYYGLLMSVGDELQTDLAKELNMHHRTLTRQLMKVVDAGLAPTWVEGEEPLPPLIVKFDATDCLCPEFHTNSLRVGGGQGMTGA
jgi:hypothetical protein